jgi:protein O-mannosyl-transferase
VNVSRKQLTGLGLVIFVGALWLHWPSVQGGFLAGMDDDKYLQQAIRLKGLNWDALKWAFTDTQPYYHPLPRLSHVLDYQMWGTNAAGHHATSVVLHALNAVLVFGFLWTLLGATSLTPSERLMMAFGVAVVFAIHPLQVESVAWMSGRTQLLCTTFEIGCLWGYVSGARRWMVWSLFAGALLCKPMAVTLPFVMLAIDYYPLRRFERLGWAPLLREKAALVALGLATAAVTMLSESHTGGLMVPLAVIHWPQRVFLAVQSLLFYPWKLVWPASLEPFYPLLSGSASLLLPVFPMVLSVVVIAALCIWRGRRTPALLAGLGAYVMLILPVSGLLQTGLETVATRHVYLAMLPLLLLLGGMVVWGWRRGAMITRLALGCLLAGELCFFGLRTQSLTPVWRNDETLWRAVLARFPDFAVGHYSLGFALAHAGRTKEAIGEYELALRIIPDYAEAHCGLGVALEKLGRSSEAIDQYQQALANWPDYADAHYDLGLALVRLGETQEAIKHWEQAVRINPDFAEAYCNLGAAFETLGRTPEAIERYEEALKHRPGLVVAQNALARLKISQ